jgi:hypothetical protein
MAADDSVWEWDVASVGEISIPAPNPLFGGGAQAFHFKSRLARYGAVYMLVNASFGPSLPFKKLKNLSTAFKNFSRFGMGKTFSFVGENPYTRFHVEDFGAFSGDDLDGAIGQSYVAGASLGGGYQFAAISANQLRFPFGRYFRFVNVSGKEFGVDVSVGVKTGVWLRLYETVYS